MKEATRGNDEILLPDWPLFQTIPLEEMFHMIQKRVIGGNLKGIDKTTDIPIPIVDPLFLGFQTQCIHFPLVDTDKIIVCIPFAKFSTVFQLILCLHIRLFFVLRQK